MEPLEGAVGAAVAGVAARRDTSRDAGGEAGRESEPAGDASRSRHDADSGGDEDEGSRSGGSSSGGRNDDHSSSIIDSEGFAGHISQAPAAESDSHSEGTAEFEDDAPAQVQGPTFTFVRTVGYRDRLGLLVLAATLAAYLFTVLGALLNHSDEDVWLVKDHPSLGPEIVALTVVAAAVGFAVGVARLRAHAELPERGLAVMVGCVLLVVLAVVGLIQGQVLPALAALSVSVGEAVWLLRVRERFQFAGILIGTVASVVRSETVIRRTLVACAMVQALFLVLWALVFVENLRTADAPGGFVAMVVMFWTLYFVTRVLQGILGTLVAGVFSLRMLEEADRQNEDSSAHGMAYAEGWDDGDGGGLLFTQVATNVEDDDDDNGDGGFGDEIVALDQDDARGMVSASSARKARAAGKAVAGPQSERDAHHAQVARDILRRVLTSSLGSVCVGAWRAELAELLWASRGILRSVRDRLRALFGLPIISAAARVGLDLSSFAGRGAGAGSGGGVGGAGRSFGLDRGAARGQIPDAEAEEVGADYGALSGVATVLHWSWTSLVCLPFVLIDLIIVRGNKYAAARVALRGARWGVAAHETLARLQATGMDAVVARGREWPRAVSPRLRSWGAVCAGGHGAFSVGLAALAARGLCDWVCVRVAAARGAARGRKRPHGVFL